MKRDKLYLAHIGECIRKVEAYTIEGEAYFFQDTRTQDAVLRNLQVLSESVKRLSPDVKNRFPEIDWVRIVGFRNALVHDYLGIRLERVWEVIQQNLPALKAAVDEVLLEHGINLDER